MLRKILLSKIHNARVTEANLNYVGSITIDEELLRAAGMLANEFVMVADVDNGSRFETYVIKGKAGSGVIGLNGAAAHLVNIGDRIIIFSMGYIESGQMEPHESNVVICDEHNRIAQQLRYPSSLDESIEPLPVV